MYLKIFTPIKIEGFGDVFFFSEVERYLPPFKMDGLHIKYEFQMFPSLILGEVFNMIFLQQLGWESGNPQPS